MIDKEKHYEDSMSDFEFSGFDGYTQVKIICAIYRFPISEDVKKRIYELSIPKSVTFRRSVNRHTHKDFIEVSFHYDIRDLEFDTFITNFVIEVSSTEKENDFVPF